MGKKKVVSAPCVEGELAGDLDAAMTTMTDDPHLNHVPTMAGGVGREGVQAFYREHLVGKFFPPDVTIIAHRWSGSGGG
jgi:carboxymethylenebutenolidase